MEKIMTNEEIYDSEIAPELMKLCARCKELGIAFVASVEYDAPNSGRGRTEFQPPDEADKCSAAQRIVHWASRCNGNIDALFNACNCHGREHGHSSVWLLQAGNNNIKYTGNEVAAITVIGPPS